ncbi:MAG TPA: Rieske (2Fe-2S) protein [Chloroflexota bacterium]|nr:Rieske (2Fe-2S) protein [Chloroflexota bacterium]
MTEPNDRPSAEAERLNAAIDRLLAEQRPAPPVTPEEAALLRVAALLKSARPGCAEPRPAFLAALDQRLQRAQRPARPRLSRRAALAGGAAMAASAAGVALGRLAQPQPPTQSPAPARELQVNAGRWFAVARVGEVPPGAAVPFIAGAVVGHLINLDGELLALSGVCTHMGCLLRWQAAERQFLCPCHGAIFDARGEFQPRRPGTYQPPLPRLQLRVEADQVYVWSAAAEPEAPAPAPPGSTG